MKSWSKKKIVITIISLIIVLVLSYALYLYFSLKSTIESIHKPVDIQSTSNETSSKKEEPLPVTEETPSPITLLLLGIDNWESSVGRADTILVLTINPQTETIKMLSIPRDSYTEMVGLGYSDKINHSYAFGGVEMAHATVEKLLQIPIDYVVSINMEGFVELVDILGGVEVENEMAFTTDYNDYPKGKLTLTGDEALDYVRMRKNDPLGDFGRQIRQRLVIADLLDKTSSLNMVWQAPSILKAIRKHVETNITFDEMKEFPKQYKPALKNIEQLHFTKGESRIQNGIWYYFFSETELGQIKAELKDSIQNEKVISE